MKQLKIGIDIDNVIADSYPSYIIEFNKRFSTNVKYEEIFDFYHLEKHKGIGKKQTSHFIETVLHSEDFQLAIPPFEKPKEIIENWSKSGFVIHYITSRPIAVKKVTLQWLANHGFLVRNAKLHLLDIKLHDKDTDYKKEIVDKWKVDILIEDNKTIALVMDIPVLLLDRPWNQGKLPENVKRVKDWEEIEQYLAKILL